MRPILIVSGVLGGGTALVFAAAAVVGTMFPTGTLVAANPWGDQMFVRGGPVMAAPMAPGPVIVDDGTGDWKSDVQLIPDKPLGPGRRDIIVVPNDGGGS